MLSTCFQIEDFIVWPTELEHKPGYFYQKIGSLGTWDKNDLDCGYVRDLEKLNQVINLLKNPVKA